MRNKKEFSDEAQINDQVEVNRNSVEDLGVPI